MPEKSEPKQEFPQNLNNINDQNNFSINQPLPPPSFQQGFYNYPMNVFPNNAPQIQPQIYPANLSNFQNNFNIYSWGRPVIYPNYTPSTNNFFPMSNFQRNPQYFYPQNNNNQFYIVFPNNTNGTQNNNTNMRQ